jgi:methyl-accepting chemotaxis protein
MMPAPPLNKNRKSAITITTKKKESGAVEPDRACREDKMKFRVLSIQARMNIGFGIWVLFIALLCLTSFTSTVKVDAKATEALQALDQGAGQKNQTVSSGVSEILRVNKAARLYLLIFGILPVVLGYLSALAIKRSILQPLGRMTSIASTLAQGDLTLDIGAARKDEFRDVKAALRTQIETWRTVLGEMKSAAGGLSLAAQELNVGAEQMSGGFGDQANRSSQVAAATEEMSQAILDMARNANSIADSASSTVSVAKEGDQIVTRSTEKVKEIAHIVDNSACLVKSLGERSSQIGTVVQVIKDIADQTNLLALNAAIEAARAGEQGRGFAVVADEVRKLAERTARSTSEIEETIKAIQDEVSKVVGSMDDATRNVNLGVELVIQAGSALQAIVQTAGDLHLKVHQIASATDQMSATSEEINRDIEQIASVSKDGCLRIRQVADASMQLTKLSNTMEKTWGRFKLP